jgi:hypothetical protein
MIYEQRLKINHAKDIETYLTHKLDVCLGLNFHKLFKPSDIVTVAQISIQNSIAAGRYLRISRYERHLFSIYMALFQKLNTVSRSFCLNFFPINLTTRPK